MKTRIPPPSQAWLLGDSVLLPLLADTNDLEKLPQLPLRQLPILGRTPDADRAILRRQNRLQ